MTAFIEQWQTLIVGVLALIAAFCTIWATIRSARIQTRAIEEATRQDIAAMQKNAHDTINAMRTTTKEQVEAITRQNELLRATEQRKEARDKKALADSILPRIRDIKRRAKLNIYSEDGLRAVPLGTDKVFKTTKEVVGDLSVFNLFLDRIGVLGPDASEAFFVLEKECDFLKNGLGSGRDMRYVEFEPKVQNLITTSGELIDILEVEIARAGQILDEN